MLTSRFSLLILLLSLQCTTYADGEVLFKETFDSQEDWTSDAWAAEGILPSGWYGHRVDELWSPRTGYPDKHPSAEILSNNKDKARGGVGKSFVAWRESYDPGWKKWNSDSILVKYFPEGFSEVYVEFWITFSSDMIKSYHDNAMGNSKLFRVYHFNGDEDAMFSFFGEENSPKYLWDLTGGTQYGVRNFMSFYARGPNHGNDGTIPGLPRQLGYNGDISLSYKTNLEGMAVDGSDANLSNKVDGGFISDQSGPAALDDVFGNEQTWTKMAFYVRMNSAPGVQDGVAMQWVDNQRIFVNENIDWVRSDWDMVKWNSVAISGNDFFRAYPNDVQHEDWYAMDDLVIRDSIPDMLISGKLAPEPPTNISVE